MPSKTDRRTDGETQGEAADEDREAAEERPLLGCQEVVAPSDGVAHRLETGGQVARAAGQEREATLQPRDERCRREDARPRRRQLDRQRQPVEAPAEGGDGGGVGIGQREGRIGGAGTLDEERDRRSLRQDVETGPCLVGRQWEGRDGVLLLAGEAEPRPARRQDVQGGAGGEESGEVRGGLDEMLQVVENQQELAIVQRRG
jgi:hypothetical protein